MINDNNTVCNINYKNMAFILCSYFCVSSLYQVRTTWLSSKALYTIGKECPKNQSLLGYSKLAPKTNKAVCLQSL